MKIMFTKRLLPVLLSSILLIAGCKKETPDPTPANSVTANAGTDQTVQAGQTVTLDGSASTDSQNKPLTYQWSFTKKPTNSTINLSGATTPKPTFIPDQVGEYEIELKVSNENGQSTDKVLVTAGALQPLSLAEQINVETILEDRIANPDLPDYIANKNVIVTSQLTIKPGVVIAFARDVSMEMQNGTGTIIAKGEATKKIRFTGQQNSKGYWAGIMIYSASSANELSNVEILYAGSRNMLSATKAGLTLFGGSHAQVALKNSLISESGGYGLHAADGTVLPQFTSNTFSKNTEAGVKLAADNVRYLDAASVFTSNNGRNIVEVVASNLLKPSSGEEVVWNAFTDKTPYRIMGQIAVEAGWKILPGVTMEMTSEAGLAINSSGYLTAKGTATNRIVFTGVTKTAGFWRGIIFYSANNQNILENAEVSYGGSVAILSGKKACVAVFGGTPAKLNVKNSTFKGSAGYGIFVSYKGQINDDASTTNTFESNANGNVFVEK
ncbi:PKD domain-containing protein [Cytophagaceae bacterium YF14B1]|uniref:PKD domain-containing protein n=1 Tax=Xanthocytophaga flava TaxID=3048013 RepID=A0AAE3QYT8_9BACT|nr:PKD domain-containing protein [Xanthocytophaga flavus]MDJ1485665.1 PKD domain-containing protein [Xanthocytophaga flavus]